MKQRLLIPSLDAPENPEASEQKPAQKRSLPVLNLGKANFLVDARGAEDVGLSTTYTTRPEEVVIRVGEAVGTVVDQAPTGQTLGMVSNDAVGVDMGLYEETFAAVSELTDHVRSLVERVRNAQVNFDERQDFSSSQTLDHVFHTAISEAGLLLSLTRELRMDEAQAQSMAAEMRQSRQEIWKAILDFDLDERVKLRTQEMEEWYQILQECYDYDFSELASDVINRSLVAFARYYEGAVEPHLRLYERNKANPYFGYPAYLQVDKVIASFEIGFFKFFTILQDQAKELKKVRSESEGVLGKSDIFQEEQDLESRVDVLVGGLEHLADRCKDPRLGHKFESSINRLGKNVDGKLTGF